MTATATTPSARTRGRSRAVVELPASPTSSPALDTLTGADPTRAVTSGVPVQMPVDALRLHPANPAHRHDEAFEGLRAQTQTQMTAWDTLRGQMPSWDIIRKKTTKTRR